MSRPMMPRPVLRLCSCLSGDRARFDEVEAALSPLWGPVCRRSTPFPFEVSGYYREELGDEVERLWFVFEKLMPPEELPAFRHGIASLEDAWRVEGMRRVNLDPGYLDFGKLVLASLKEAPDKIYLDRGVWAHTCLRWSHGAFEAPVHSFPDFRDGRFDAFMTEMRQLYRRLLRKLPPAEPVPLQ